jgi:hypothetical protein
MEPEIGNGERMYRRLQVPPEASTEQIRIAYRRLAHDVHPDANPDDPEASRRFREITEAYEILSSPERRASYDQAKGKPGISVHQRGASGPAGTYGPARTTSGPIVIETGFFPVGWPPLVAGPVRVVPPGNTTAEVPTGRDAEVSRPIEAIWSWWRSY